MDFSQEYHIHFGTVFILWFLNTISVLNTTLFCGRIIYPHFYICRRFRLFSYGFAAQKRNTAPAISPFFFSCGFSSTIEKLYWDYQPFDWILNVNYPHSPLYMVSNHSPKNIPIFLYIARWYNHRKKIDTPRGTVQISIMVYPHFRIMKKTNHRQKNSKLRVSTCYPILFSFG